jgi:hypothetical protein
VVSAPWEAVLVIAASKARSRRIAMAILPVSSGYSTRGLTDKCCTHRLTHVLYE